MIDRQLQPKESLGRGRDCFPLVALPFSKKVNISLKGKAKDPSRKPRILTLSDVMKEEHV
jgi:hypothetical protein